MDKPDGFSGAAALEGVSPLSPSALPLVALSRLPPNSVRVMLLCVHVHPRLLLVGGDGDHFLGGPVESVHRGQYDAACAWATPWARRVLPLLEAPQVFFGGRYSTAAYELYVVLCPTTSLPGGARVGLSPTASATLAWQPLSLLEGRPLHEPALLGSVRLSTYVRAHPATSPEK